MKLGVVRHRFEEPNHAVPYKWQKVPSLPKTRNSTQEGLYKFHIVDKYSF